MLRPGKERSVSIRPNVGERERAVLRDLLDAMETGAPTQVHQFRMAHVEDRAVIDKLVGPYIAEGFGRYRLTLAGLQACDSELARRRIEDFNALLPLLRETYVHREPGANIPTATVTETAQRLGVVLKRADARKALSYALPYSGAVGGYNSGSDSSFVDSFTLSEGILDLMPIPLELPTAVEETPELSFVPADASQERETPLDLAGMHEEVQKTVTKLASQGHHRQAIFDSLVALDEYVQKRSGLGEVGDALMSRVFSPERPILRVSRQLEEQRGFMFLFKGAVKAIRNRYGHKTVSPGSPEEALETLAFVSLLFRFVDAAKRPRKTARGRPGP